MGRRKRKPVEVEIHQIAEKGYCAGRTESNEVLFVKDAVPGDVVIAEPIKKKKGVWFAGVAEIISPSKDRILPFCKHFYQCGGCKWQHLKYEKQLEEKENIIKDAFGRIGGVVVNKWDPIISAAPHTRYYRNKLEFTFSDRGWLTSEQIQQKDIPFERRSLGFHKAGAFAHVLNIEECHLQREPQNFIRNGLRRFAINHDLSFYNIRSQKGYLRNLIIRTTTTGDIMVILALGEDDKEKESLLMKFLAHLRPQISSIYFVTNKKKNDSLAGCEFRLKSGKEYIQEQLGQVRYQIGPESFFQTNPYQAKRLYDKVYELAAPSGNETIYDLYTGTGSLALYVGRNNTNVVGIDNVQDSIDHARVNARLNGKNPTRFYMADVKDLLNSDFVQKHGKPEIILTDPPRAGMHKEVVNTLLDIEAEKIVYVSCNPATMARDVEILSDKYQVNSVTPVDMFPHTSHIEAVASLSKI